MLTVGDLFSGIGGFSLGLERAGMKTIWFSEIDPYASAILARHWPGVPNLGDVRGITAATVADAGCERLPHDGGEMRRAPMETLQNDGTRERSYFPDLLCGGFPCQDISNAGKRAGIDGERSGLWAEFARIIGELRPRYVLIENVAALLGRGIERVLGDLAALGFDAEWHCIPASAVGAPHRRDRVWIVAYAQELQRDGGRVHTGSDSESGRRVSEFGERCADTPMAYADQPRLPIGEMLGRIQRGEGFTNERENACMGGRFDWDEGRWFAESGMGRISDGVRNRVDRLRCLGSAIVPQIAEIIGRAIIQAEAERMTA